MITLIAILLLIRIRSDECPRFLSEPRKYMISVGIHTETVWLKHQDYRSASTLQASFFGLDLNFSLELEEEGRNTNPSAHWSDGIWIGCQEKKQESFSFFFFFL